MANNVIGLFSSEEVAQRVIDELHQRGFNRNNITHLSGDQDDLEAELEREGVSDADASYYAAELRQGGTIVSVRAQDDQVDEAVDIMNRYTDTADDTLMDDASYAAATPTTGFGDTDTADTDTAYVDTAYMDTDTDLAAGTSVDRGSSEVETNPDDQRLAVVEERLRIGKREVQRGGMRVRRVVTEREVEEQVVLRDETIRVERRPVDRTLSEADGDLFTEQTFEFTETDEEAVVAKEARVVEEVVVGKDVEERTETVHDTVRRADVEIEEVAANQMGLDDTTENLS